MCGEIRFGINVSSKAPKILNINIWKKRVGSATRFALNFLANYTFFVSCSPAILIYQRLSTDDVISGTWDKHHARA